MSSFIAHIPSLGLIEMPPLSNVMALPQRTIGGPSASSGACSTTTNRAGSAEPWATPSRAPIFSSAISSGPSTVQRSPAAPAISSAAAARTRGLRMLPGRVVRSRAKMALSARITPRRNPAAISGSFASSSSTTVRRCRWRPASSPSSDAPPDPPVPVPFSSSKR